MARFINPFTDVGFRLPFKARNAVFQRLEQIVDIAAMSKEDRMKYDESIKVYRDRLAVMEFERLKGRAEANLNFVRNLKQMGFAPEFIAQATGLSVEEVERLMNEAD